MTVSHVPVGHSLASPHGVPVAATLKQLFGCLLLDYEAVCSVGMAGSPVLVAINVWNFTKQIGILFHNNKVGPFGHSE